MNLGAFSISLAVKDLELSRDFYKKLGFEAVAGDVAENWLVMRSGETNIGLFQDMFDKNTLTFNPGWDSQAREVKEFTDVRALQQRLKDQGIKLESEVEEGAASGPGHFFFFDPDGNPILIDQHR